MFCVAVHPLTPPQTLFNILILIHSFLLSLLFRCALEPKRSNCWHYYNVITFLSSQSLAARSFSVVWARQRPSMATAILHGNGNVNDNDTATMKKYYRPINVRHWVQSSECRALKTSKLSTRSSYSVVLVRSSHTRKINNMYEFRILRTYTTDEARILYFVSWPRLIKKQPTWWA